MERWNVSHDFLDLNVEPLWLEMSLYVPFAKATEMKSHLGFELPMVDKPRGDNIFHYGFSPCHRLTRSMMTAKVHILVHTIDDVYDIKKMLEELLRPRVKIEPFVDSTTLFYVFAKSDNTAEKWLLIDVSALEEIYRTGELKKIEVIPRKKTAADVLTKSVVSKHSNVEADDDAQGNHGVMPIGWVTKAHMPKHVSVEKAFGVVGRGGQKFGLSSGISVL